MTKGKEKSGKRLLFWLCIGIVILMQPLMMLHLQTHVEGKAPGFLGKASACWEAAEDNQGEDCPVCRMFQGLSRILPLVFSNLLLFVFLFLLLAFQTRLSPGSTERQIYRLRGPPPSA